MKQRTKKVFERCLALLLTAALVFTAVDLGWALNSDEVTAADKQAVTYTAAGLVADNYADLSAQEKAVLGNAAINSTEFSVTAPAAEDGLTAVDSENQIIYAKNYVDGGYTWTPVSAEVVVGTEVLAAVDLAAGEATYEGAAYDASAAFTCEENGYQVIVKYELYIDVDTAEQAQLLNTPFWMADAMNNMAAIKSVASTLNTIIKYGAPELEQYLVVLDGTREAEIIESWLAQRDAYNASELSALINAEDGYNNAANKVENILTKGAEYKASALTVYDDFVYLQTSKIANYMDPDMFSMLSDVVADLEPAATSDWDILALIDVLKEDAEYGNLDALASAAIGNSAEHDVQISASLLADTAEIACSVNRYDVTVTVKATVIEADNTTSALSYTTVLNLASGVSMEEVVAEIEADGVEAESLLKWNDGTDYAISTDNYDRVVETSLSDTLTTDATYTITYSPKAVKADIYEDGAIVKTIDASYGSVIILPLSETEGQTYEYTVDGVVYEEGETYRLTGNTSFTRELGKAKTALRVYDLVVDQYGDLSGEAAAILSNLAVNSDYVYVRDIEDTLLTLSDDGESLTALSYNAGNGMTWEPVAAYVKNGTEVVQTITEFAADGTAAIKTDDYTTVEAAYQLKVDVTDEEVLEALNVPYTLVTEATQQLADLKTLAGYESNIDQVTYGLLDLVGPKLNEYSQAAIAEIALNGCEADGALYLSTYIEGYKALTTDAERLNYYYSNGLDTKIKNQIDLIANSMAVIVEDTALPELLVSLGYGEYVEKLETVAEDLEALKDKFPAKSDKVNTSNGAYEALLDAILAAKGNVTEYTTQDGLYCTATLSKAAADRAIVKVTVQVVDGDDAVVATKSYEDSFVKKNGMEAADVDAFLASVAQFEAELAVDKAHYTCTVEGTLPEAGAALTGNVTVVYTWAPNEYTVTIDGEDDQTFTYDNMTITLPASTDANIKYYYTVGTKTYEVTTEDVVIRLTKDEFAALYGEGTTYEITRESVNIADEIIVDFVASLNDALVSAGLDGTANFVAFEDAAGKISVVLRLSPNAKMMDAVEAIAMVLVNQAYVELGDQPLKDSAGVHVDVLVEAILNSGIGTNSLIVIINENGDIVENVKDKVAGQTVITESLMGVTATDALGGLLMETTTALSTTGDNIPLYISLQDYNQNASQLQQVREALVASSQYVLIECSDGKLNVDMTAPDAAYEAYMALMLAEGQINISDFETPSLVEMVDFALSTEIESVVNDEAVTAKTLMNTAKQLGIERDFSAYEDYMNTALKAVRALIDDTLDNSEITSTNDADTPKDTYTFDAFCPSDKVVSVLGLSDAYADFIVGDIEVPVEATLSNCYDEYEAAVLDPNAEEVLKMAQFTKDANATIATVNDESVVVLLGDVDTITADKAILLNLNGFTVDTLTANASVVVVDSRLATAKAGTINNISGDVTITAGTYASNVTAYLPDGYEQNSGVVSNRFYTITEDEAGNITIEIQDDFLSTDVPTAWKTIAVEMVLDALFNAYTWGSVTVDGNEIYNIELYDLLAQYKAGLGVVAAELVEEINCEGVTAFANDVLAELTNFAEMAEEINADGVIAVYDLITAPWKIYASVEGEGDDNYIAGNLATGEKTNRTITIKVVGDNKADLAELCEALAEIVTFNECKLSLDDLTLTGRDLSYEGGAALDVTVDFTKSEKPYIAVLGIVMAYGADDNAALVEAVNAYLADGKTDALVTAIEALTTSDVISALNKAKGVEFADMVAALGIQNADTAVDLYATYDDLLNIGYILVGKSGITGGDRTIASFGTGEYATYYADKEYSDDVYAKFTLILAEKDQEEPGPKPPVDPDEPETTPEETTPEETTPEETTPEETTPEETTPEETTPEETTPEEITPEETTPEETTPEEEETTTAPEDPGTETGDISTTTIMMLMLVALAAIVVLRKKVVRD